MSRPRLCARPACGAPATASLVFQYAARIVWLEGLGEAQPYKIDLCSRHADRLNVPMGWTGEDHRAVGPAEVPTPVAS